MPLATALPLRANLICSTRSLAGLNYLHKAMPGGHGGVKKLAGHQGQHCIVQVPYLWSSATSKDFRLHSESIPTYLLPPEDLSLNGAQFEEMQVA